MPKYFQHSNENKKHLAYLYSYSHNINKITFVLIKYLFLSQKLNQNLYTSPVS